MENFKTDFIKQYNQVHTNPATGNKKEVTFIDVKVTNLKTGANDQFHWRSDDITKLHPFRETLYLSPAVSSSIANKLFNLWLETE